MSLKKLTIPGKRGRKGNNALKPEFLLFQGLSGQVIYWN